MVVTTFYALFPADAWSQLEKVAKIQLFIFLTILVMQSRERIKALVWVSTLSIAYFGIKGGVYTIMKGGGGMVLGPNGGFIAGNTEISLALTMTLPLMRWLQLQTQRPALKWALGISMALVFIAMLGSYSRGGFLALFAMAACVLVEREQKVFRRGPSCRSWCRCSLRSCPTHGGTEWARSRRLSRTARRRRD